MEPGDLSRRAAGDAGRRRSSSGADRGPPPLLRHGGLALAATVTGREAAATRHYRAALAAGVSAGPLAEIARMAHLLCGFPRAIQGLKAFADALAAEGVARPRDPEADRRRGGAASRARGETLFRRVYGPSSAAVIARLEAAAPGYSRWVLEDGYGRVLARPGLAPRERELLTVAALAALRCPIQLASHVRGALRLGASTLDLDAMLSATTAEIPRRSLAAARALVAAAREPRPHTTGSRKSGARQTRRRRRQ